MIKMMLVAGNNSKSLATFLEQRGTFTLDFIYNDLNGNRDELLRQVIKVDKFVYVYRIDEETKSASMNIRLDMQSLREMLVNNKFFRPEEILFLCGSGKVYNQAKKYFLSVMDECGFNNFVIRTVNGIVSFAAIYDNLIGITLNKDFKNHYRNLYRRNRGDDATMAFEPGDDRDVSVEAFDYSGVKMWEEKKKLATSVEQDIPIEDSDEYRHPNWVNPSFDGILMDDILPPGNLIIVTGAKHGGKSTWGIQLANSATANGQRTAIYDFTRMQRLQGMVSENALPFKTISPFDMMHLKEYSGDVICSFNFNESLLPFLSFVLRQRFGVFQVIVAVVDEQELPKFIEVLGSMITILINTVYPNISDVKAVSQAISRYKCKKIVPISFSGIENPEKDLSADEIKQNFVTANIIKPYKFVEFNNAWLFKKLIGGNCVQNSSDIR